MNLNTLPCFVAARDEINQRCHALGNTTVEGFTIDQPDRWTLRFSVACANGEKFAVDVDLLDVMTEGGLIESLTEILH